MEICETESEITFVNEQESDKNQEINTRISKQMKNVFTKHEFVNYVNLKSEYAVPLLLLKYEGEPNYLHCSYICISAGSTVVFACLARRGFLLITTVQL